MTGAVAANTARATVSRGERTPRHSWDRSLGERGHGGGRTMKTTQAGQLAMLEFSSLDPPRGDVFAHSLIGIVGGRDRLKSSGNITRSRSSGLVVITISHSASTRGSEFSSHSSSQGNR